MYPSNISEIKALADANHYAAKKVPILNLNLEVLVVYEL
jgi:hypothetical protein